MTCRTSLYTGLDCMYVRLQYEQALRNEGAGAAATLAQTQRLFQAYAGDAEDVDDKAARNELVFSRKPPELYKRWR